MVEIKKTKTKASHECTVCFRRPKLTKDQKACFSCLFWNLWYKDRNDPTVVRAGGKHYTFYAEMKSPRQDSSKRYKIQFLGSDKCVVTSNVYSQGEIPQIWQLFGLNDNAKLMEVKGK